MKTIPTLTSVEEAAQYARRAPTGRYRLELPCDADLDALLAFVQTQAAAWLVELDTHEFGFTDDAIHGLASSPHLAALESLAVATSSLSARSVRTLLTAPALPGLVALNLAGNCGASTLLDAVMLYAPGPRLRGLGLGCLDLSDADLVRLAAWPGLASVQDLDLTVNDISAEGIRALLSSPHLTSLTALNLWGLGLGSDLAEALASAPRFSQLTRLNLGGNTLGPEGAALLASSPHAPNLLDLGIEENRIGDAGLQALLASAITASVTALNLEHNSITDEGVRMLARSPRRTHLRDLSLRWNLHTVDALACLRGADKLHPELRSGLELPTLEGVERKLEAWLARREEPIFEVFRDGDEVIARRLVPMFPDQGMTEEYDMVLFMMREGRLTMHYQTLRPIRMGDYESLGEVVLGALSA